MRPLDKSLNSRPMSDSDVSYIPDSSSESSSCESDIDNDAELDEQTINSQEWSFPVVQTDVFEYCGEGGFGRSVPDASHDTIEFFKPFVGDEILDLMVLETNRNGQQLLLGQSTLSPHSRVGCWTDTDKDEMTVFLGLLLWMRMVRMPTLECYWRKSRIFENSVAARLMTRNLQGSPKFQAVFAWKS